jgi:integrase
MTEKVEIREKTLTSSGGILGRIDQPRNDSGLQASPTESPALTSSDNIEICPDCGFTGSIDRAGHRRLKYGTSKQRWLCPKCGYRFSQKTSINYTGAINTTNNVTRDRQVCVLNQEAKNLNATETKTVAGEKSQLEAGVEGLVAQYMAYLEREGYAQESQYPYWIKRLAKLGANLLDPESVKQVIGQQKVKNGTKIQYVYAYDSFAKMLKIPWSIPHYTQEESLPFVPEEKEADQIIAFCRSKRMATFLQTLKETFADPTEALRIRWIDITGNVISINFPVKNHNAGQIEVSSKLIAMLNSLPKTSERIFPTKYGVISGNYIRMRKRCAEIHKNPRILSIEFRSFRHLGGSMIAHYTNGNVLTVKRLLRHKRVENTMKYIQMIHFGDKDFEVATATTPEEVKQLGVSGWTKYDEMTFNGTQMHFYKKPKRFSNL